MLLAYLYRFPIPLAGYQSGISAVPAAVIAVFVYGFALGGFLVLALIGGVSGWIARRRFPDPGQRQRWLVSLSVGGTFLMMLILANLDHIIGPW